ncbi:hypothetical protein [Prevotella sp. MGM2]|uniref:hypothetical protein n=1 Tax=Prevotella sp. MGM2 TaxID=2033406 RepID=UPI000CE9C916|nr:hypothetical protein [Prevotella sp. MGM2]GAY31552.1 hypothetical protein PvtlMGM2_2405 [Prevotella sp. MGM2]
MAGYTEEQYEQSQAATPVDPPRGSADWAAQNSGDNAPELTPTPNPAPGTLEAYEAQQTVTPPTGGASTTPTPPPPADSPAASTDTEHQTPAVSPEQQQRVDATAGTDRQIKTIQDWMDAEGNRPETEEERKKRERREKSKRIIAAVSDGISALSNLYFTSQYAPDMYNHEKGSMTNAVDARLERLKAEREKNADKYLQFSLKLGDLENERAKTLRELEAQQERQKLAREKAQREAEAHGWAAVLQPDKQREQAGKANRAEQEAITAKAEAEAAPELQRAKIATEKARKGSLDASAANSRASAAAHGRSNQNEFSAWDEHGNEHKFRTREAAEAYAKQHGTWKEEDETETTTTETRRTPESKPQKRTSTKTTKGGHAGKPSPTGRQSPTA